MSKRQLTEQELEAKYLNKVISFLRLDSKTVVGKVDRIAVEEIGGELMVIFWFSLKNWRMTCSVQHFIDNSEILS